MRSELVVTTHRVTGIVRERTSLARIAHALLPIQSLLRYVFRERSSTGGRRPRQGMPHGCRLASHSGPAIAETDSTMRKFVPPPTAIGLVRCHARYSALRAEARYGGYADFGVLPRRVIRTVT